MELHREGGEAAGGSGYFPLLRSIPSKFALEGMNKSP